MTGSLAVRENEISETEKKRDWGGLPLLRLPTKQSHRWSGNPSLDANGVDAGNSVNASNLTAAFVEALDRAEVL